MEWNRESEEMLLIQAISNLEWKEMLSTLQNSLWVPGLILGYFNPLHQNSHDLARVLCCRKSSFVGNTSLCWATLHLQSLLVTDGKGWVAEVFGRGSWEVSAQLGCVTTGDFWWPQMAFVGLLKLLQYLSLDTSALLVRVLYSCLALPLRNAIAVVVLYSVCNIANI